MRESQQLKLLKTNIHRIKPLLKRNEFPDNCNLFVATIYYLCIYYLNRKKNAHKIQGIKIHFEPYSAKNAVLQKVPVLQLEKGKKGEQQERSKETESE